MLGMPEVRVGSMPGAGATQLLPRGIGLSAANYLLLTGESIPAEKALQFGLVSEVLDPADLLPRAIAIADRIARNAPLSVRATRDAVTVGLDLPLAQGLEYERHLFGLIRATADRAEGRAAFRERRDPRFEGR